GDNPWGLGQGWYSEFKYRNLGLFKHAYTKYVLTKPDGTHRFANRPPGQANGTAYAVRPHPNVQLVTLDVFRRGYRKGRWTVRRSIDRQQFDWLDRVLTKANEDGVETIIVQAHTPIAAPVRERHTSGLMYEKGVGSPLWRLMRRHAVDLYLAGEVHAVTSSYRDGITQIAHGGLIKTGDANYIVVKITGPVITIQAKAFPGASVDRGNALRLWHTNLDQYTLQAGLNYPRESTTTGEMVLSTDNAEPLVHSGTLELGFQRPTGPPVPAPPPDGVPAPGPVG
ncbi:MAG: metallophosphoesterase family protein, partial [Thermoleophilia bacterium]